MAMIVLKNGISKEFTYLAALRHLRKMLSSNEPELIELYARSFLDHPGISYADLKKAIEDGYLTDAMIQTWQNEYAKFVYEHVEPIMKKVAYSSFSYSAGKLLYPQSSGTYEAVNEWISKHLAEHITRVSSDQKKALNTIIKRTVSSGETSSQLAKVIRPLVGLTKPQMTANYNYYTTMAETLTRNGSTDAKARHIARKRSLEYAARQHRKRAADIARTELATAYNNSEYICIKEAQKQNLIGNLKKKWCTAGNEGVCKHCKLLDAMEIDIDDYFQSDLGPVLVPPLHVRCRCVVLYIEV